MAVRAGSVDYLIAVLTVIACDDIGRQESGQMSDVNVIVGIGPGPADKNIFTDVIAPLWNF